MKLSKIFGKKIGKNKKILFLGCILLIILGIYLFRSRLLEGLDQPWAQGKKIQIGRKTWILDWACGFFGPGIKLCFLIPIPLEWYNKLLKMAGKKTV